MKIPIFTDIHLKNYRNSGVTVENLLRQLKYVLDQSTCDACFFGGDMFDTFGNIDSEVYSKTVEFFGAYFRSNPKYILYGISGNHDYKYQSCSSLDSYNVSTFSILCSLFPKNMKEMHPIFTNVINVHGLNVLGVPYLSDDVYFNQLLDRIPDGLDLLILHQSLNGQYGSTIDTVKVSKKARIVVVGHIHETTCFHDNIYQIGSLGLRSKADLLRESSYAVIDTETKRLRSYGLPHEIVTKPIIKHNLSGIGHLNINASIQGDAALGEITLVKQFLNIKNLNYEI